MVNVGKTEVYTLEIKGQKIELTPAEAEELYEGLKAALGKKDEIVLPKVDWPPMPTDDSQRIPRKPYPWIQPLPTGPPIWPPYDDGIYKDYDYGPPQVID